MADALGTRLDAIVIGSGIEDLASSLGDAGPQRVFVFDQPDLAEFSIDGYGKAVLHTAKETDPAVIFFAASADGKDAAAYVASDFSRLSGRRIRPK